ncbi:MAG: PEP/pyruvate-binding domain-containing protein [Patescibacteria group bacterium]
MGNLKKMKRIAHRTEKVLLFVRELSSISKKDIALAGGKGASLGDLMRAGLPVPAGFVVTAAAFDRFLEENELLEDIDAQLSRVNYKDTNSIDRASNVIRALILEAPFPKDLRQEVIKFFGTLNTSFVAVRSSATAEDSKTASWAGELETYLNTIAKTLFANIQKCWASLFSPRAIFYRHEKRLHRVKVSVAVVVQAMVESEVAGIAFTVHPVTKDKNQMIIEAGWGLGEAVVSGQITPDSYVLHKKDYSVIDLHTARQEKKLVRNQKGNGDCWVSVPKKLRTKQKLTTAQIKTLAELCMRVERHERFPCDIEWALVRGKFYLLQSRPITTL